MVSVVLTPRPPGRSLMKSKSRNFRFRVIFENDARLELKGLTELQACRLHSIFAKSRVNLDLEKTAESGPEFLDWEHLEIFEAD